MELELGYGRVVIGRICPLGREGISDWGIMIHLFFLHLPTQKLRCWSFFISLGRWRLLAERSRDLIQFSKESSSMHDAFPIQSLLFSLPCSYVVSRQRKKHTHKSSYIIIPGKTPLTQDCSFSVSWRQLELGTRSREFPIFSAPYQYESSKFGEKDCASSPLFCCCTLRFYITIKLDVVCVQKTTQADKFNLARQMAKV